MRPFKVLKKNIPDNRRVDVYHRVINLTWSKTVLLFLGVFFSVNVIFATLYWLDKDGLLNSRQTWTDCFYFSVQTLSTIGYGNLSPTGHYANILVTIEAALGTFWIAISTGFFFSKLSRPFARIEFSKYALINVYDERPTLHFRMVNIRDNELLDSKVTVTLFKSFRTSEGQTIRRFLDLNLVRSKVQLFSLSMNLMHVIDEESPLYEAYKHRDFPKDYEILVTTIGTDTTFGQTVHSSHLYKASDIVFDRYFKDMITLREDGTRELDYANFNELQ